MIILIIRMDLFWIVDNLDKLDNVGVVQLLHDGNLAVHLPTRIDENQWNLIANVLALGNEYREMERCWLRSKTW